MAPLPYPHRVTFLASTWIAPPEHAALVPYFARLIAVIVFDHLVHHPVVTLGDLEDERLTDDSGRLLDANHPELADSLDWLFRVSRRHEVLGFELSIDPARPHPPVLRSRQPRGDGTEDFTASPNLALSQQLGQCLARWLTARRLPSVGLLPPFVFDDLHAAAIRLAACDERLTHRGEAGSELRALIQPPARLAVPFLRVLSVLSRDDAPAIDPTILALEPSHPVARRNRYVAGVLQQAGIATLLLDLLSPHPRQAAAIAALLNQPVPGTPRDADGKPLLTPRQTRILQLVAAGSSDRDVARALGVSIRTVQTHLQHIYRTLGVRSRTEALAHVRALAVTGAASALTGMTSS